MRGTRLSMTLTLAIPSQRGALGPMRTVSASRRMKPRGSLSRIVRAKSAGEKPPGGARGSGEGGRARGFTSGVVEEGLSGAPPREARRGTSGASPPTCCGSSSSVAQECLRSTQSTRTGVEEEGRLAGRAIEQARRRAAHELELPVALQRRDGQSREQQEVGTVAFGRKLRAPMQANRLHLKNRGSCRRRRRIHGLDLREELHELETARLAHTAERDGIGHREDLNHACAVGIGASNAASHASRKRDLDIIHYALSAKRQGVQERVAHIHELGLQNRAVQSRGHRDGRPHGVELGEAHPARGARAEHGLQFVFGTSSIDSAAFTVVTLLLHSLPLVS